MRFFEKFRPFSLTTITQYSLDYRGAVPALLVGVCGLHVGANVAVQLHPVFVDLHEKLLQLQDHFLHLLLVTASSRSARVAKGIVDRKRKRKNDKQWMAN